MRGSAPAAAHQIDRAAAKRRTDWRNRSAAWRRCGRQCCAYWANRATLKNHITQVEAQLASADREAARARGGRTAIGKRSFAHTAGEERRFPNSLAARQIELASVTDQRTAVEQELQQKRAKLNESRQAFDRLRSEVFTR